MELLNSHWLIKNIALIQLTLIILFVIIAYCIKIYTNYAEKLLQKRISTLTTWIHSENVTKLCDLKRYRRYSHLILPILKNSAQSDLSPVAHKALIKHLLLPAARRNVRAKHWYKRYIACQIFQYKLTHIDEPRLIKLIHDTTPLVSMTAASAALTSLNQSLIDAVITQFSKGRRIQASLAAQLLAKPNPGLFPLIANRLQREHNPYIRTFCYCLLTWLPRTESKLSCIESDLNNPTVNLTISVLTYLAHTKPDVAREELHHSLKHAMWERRAIAARLLESVGDTTSIPFLRQSLHDPVGWVRTNATRTLSILLKQGSI